MESLNIEEVSRWEGEGGKSVLVESKDQSSGQTSGESGSALARLPRANELLVALDKVTLKQVTAGREYITNYPRRDYAGAEVISVGPTATLAHALQVLTKHRISCLPVLEPNAVDVTKPGVFKGFVDVLDIVSFFAVASEWKEEDAEKRVLAMPVGQLIDRSHKDGAHAFHQDLLASEVLPLFAKGVHRVPVFDENTRISGLCSQYDIVCRISTLLGAGMAVGMASRSVQQYKDVLSGGKWGEGTVVGVDPSCSMREALLKMARTGLSAIAVIEHGRLVGQITAGDLVLIVPGGAVSMGGWLDKTVEFFLQQHADRVAKPMYELPSATLRAVCKAMCDQHQHHVWIVDNLESMKPEAVVTMTDICRVALYFAWPKWLQGEPRAFVAGLPGVGEEDYQGDEEDDEYWPNN